MKAPLKCMAFVASAFVAVADFNYSFCGLPGTTVDTTVTAGDGSAVCLQLNGAVRSVFTPKVDQFSAFQVVGGEGGVCCVLATAPG